MRQDGQLVFVSRWQKCYFCKEFDKQVFNKTYQVTYLMRHQFALICYIQNNWLWYLNFYVMMVEKCSMTLMYKLCIFLKINNWSNNKIILLLLSIFKNWELLLDERTNKPFFTTHSAYWLINYIHRQSYVPSQLQLHWYLVILGYL